MRHPAQAGDGGSPPRTRVRVLVVDDSLDHRELMARRLVAAGMQVSAVGTAHEAVEGSDDVDLVVLDLRLPGTDGLEVLTAIRARPRPPSVVMVTAAGSTEVAVEAMRAGAVHYLTKEPGYLDALPEVVARAWRHHDLERRTSELQRAALVLSVTTDPRELAHEVAATARRLAAARAVRLHVTPADGIEPGTVELGEPPAVDEPDHGLEAAAAEVWVSASGQVVLGLTSDGDRTAGTLRLWRQAPLADDERDLLRAFAALAGAALGNVHRMELQRRLVGELRRTLEARQDFIASISHELRTPLTAITGFSHTLRTHRGELEPERAEDLLDRIHRNAQELALLVDELLELAALERGGGSVPRRETLDLEVVLQAVLDELAPVLDGHRVSLALAATTVVGDPQLVRRTLSNLLTNAAKFSPAASRIAVSSRPVDGEVRIEVDDEGIGLRPWEARHVFDAFYRTSSSVSDAVRGSGIGLALVARYVRSMGGDVGVESTPGNGSTFWFTLPGAPVPGPSAPAGGG